VAAPCDRCPDCDAALVDRGPRRRGVVEMRPAEVERVALRLERKRCPQCGRRFEARAPGVAAKGLYGNSLLAWAAEQHYLHGAALGTLERQTNLGRGSLVGALARAAALVEGAVAGLVEQYRAAPVKHADETGWRTDGRNGWAWLFATPETSIFRFRPSRAAAVAAEVLGSEPLPGVLVVDRYGAYARAPVALQYCFAHLKRDAETAAKLFPHDREVAAFVGAWAPALSAAMRLRTLGLPPDAFARRARRLERRLRWLADREARHPAIWKLQAVFRDHPERLFHWTRAPAVPAENNLAERDLRPLVIARKVSFGSQSEAGARTRETLMTVLHTLRKRGVHPASALRAALDRLVEDPRLDPAALLFPSSPARTTAPRN